jgi:hypothetical protein
MSSSFVTEDEILSYLSRTELPTLLVEGSQDAIVFRWLENELGIINGSILPCHGRGVLLSIYEKRDRFKHGRLAWLADRDMWCFSTVPEIYSTVIFTAGYSIENDLYAGSRLESLLEPSERQIHTILLSLVCKWFAFELEEYCAGRSHKVATNIKEIVNHERLEISRAFSQKRGFKEPSEESVKLVLDDYQLKLRGKTLVQVLETVLTRPGRVAKFRSSQIVELSLKLFPDNPYLRRLVSEVQTQLR